MMTLLIIFILLFGLIYFIMNNFKHPIESNQVDLDEVNAFLKKYGGNHVSHLTFNNDKQVYWAANKKALIVYQKVGNKLVVLGDPVGKEEYVKEAIYEFIQYGKNHHLKTVFYQVTPKFLPSYQEAGYHLFKLGEEARVPLRDFSLAGKKGAKLRTRKNKFERNGYQFMVVHPPYTDEFVHQIRKISDSWLGNRKEKGFSVGFFCEHYISRFPLALLKNPKGEIIAFATLACDSKKENRTITIDLMRYVQDRPHGTMDMLFLSIFNWCKENGYDWCSMGMSPLSNIGTEKNSSKIEKVARFFFHYGNSFYNFKGLFEYKNKFFPLWEPRYLAYQKCFLPILLVQIVYLIHRRKDSAKAVKFKIIPKKLRKAG
jgi:phosphatidylglycerol lysyltransferase